VATDLVSAHLNSVSLSAFKANFVSDASLLMPFLGKTSCFEQFSFDPALTKYFLPAAVFHFQDLV